MDYAQLKAMGLVDSRPLVKHVLKIKYFPLLPKEQWKDPEVEERSTEQVEAPITVHLRGMTAADQIAVAAAIREKRDPVYLMIYRCVFNEDATRVFESEEQAACINLEMFAGIVEALNRLHGGAIKKSLPRTKRGASSRLPSAAAASRNGSSKSALKNGPSGSSTDRRTGHSTRA